MAKQAPPIAGEQSVEVEATARFKDRDGRDIRPGMSVTMAISDARDLIAVGFVRATRATYRDRAMRANAR